MTDLKRGPHQDENESSTAAKKNPRAINVDKDLHAEFSSAGIVDINHAPGS